MALITYGGRLTGGHLPNNFLTSGGIRWSEVSPQARYEAMAAYYRSNNLYEWVNEIARRQQLKGWDAKPLKNPVQRIVEFHGTHLCPGKLPEAMPLTEPFQFQAELEQIWEWSNWSQQKQVASRKFAMLGDLFLKVSTREGTETPAITVDDGATIAGGRVYLQLIEPANVTDFVKDERGFFQWLRLDIPIDVDGKAKWHTEFWDKESYRIYVHDKGTEETEEKLKQYFVDRVFLSEILPGMNFIPFAHAKNLDDGSDRGWPVCWHAVEKIDELNRHATRLAQLCFRHNKALWASLANDGSGGAFQVPAPTFANDDGEVDAWDDGDVIELPGAAKLESLAPKIDWKAALDIIKDMDHQIRQDFPELIYYDLQTSANVATDTIIKWMAPAIDRANEARQAFETALIQAQTMALTIGAGKGLFSKIPAGAYEGGLLKHAFADRPILVETSLDAASTAKAWVDVGVPMVTALRLVGFSAEEIEVIIDEQTQETKRKGAGLTDALRAAQAKFEAGDDPGVPRDPELEA